MFETSNNLSSLWIKESVTRKDEQYSKERKFLGTIEGFPNLLNFLKKPGARDEYRPVIN